MPQQIRMEALYWKRLDSTTWHVLNGINPQTTGGGNRHIAINPITKMMMDVTTLKARIMPTKVQSAALLSSSTQTV